MTATDGGAALTQVFRETILALVRRDDADLTSRQFGILLIVYLTAGPHTVRGLAAGLNAPKPAISRALDRLGELSLTQRKVGPDGSSQRPCAADSSGGGVPGRRAPRDGGDGYGASHRGGVSTRGAAPDRAMPLIAPPVGVTKHDQFGAPFRAATAPPIDQRGK